jgi:hypothetical protein
MNYMLKKYEEGTDKDKKGYVRYENIMHMISREDNLFGLQTYLKAKDKAFYVKCPYSPLIFLKSRTGKEFME